MSGGPRSPSAGPVGGLPVCGLMLGAALALAPQAARDLRAASARGAGEIAVVGARVFTGDDAGTVLEDATVLLSGGVIRAVGPAAEVECPESAQVVDGRGRTLLPGLFDLHVHLTGSGARHDRLVRGDPLLRAEQAAACGVTALLDLNAPERLIFPLRAAQRGGVVAGLPRIFTAGAALAAPGGHGTELGFPCRLVATAEDALEHARSLAEAQADVIKAMHDPGAWGGVGGLATLDAGRLTAIGEAAHRHGLRLVVHAVDWTSAREAVLAGADALAHLPLFGELDDRTLELLASRGVRVIPALAAYRGQFAALGEGVLERPLARQFVDARVRAGFREADDAASRRGSPTARAIAERFAAGEVALRRLHAAGVPLLAGSDAGTAGSFHGVSLHEELALMVSAGLGETDALLAATREAARFLGLESRLGRVVAGHEADLLLVEGNPLVRIADTENVALVVRAGQILDRGAVATRTLALTSKAAPGDPESAAAARVRLLADFEAADGRLPPHRLSGLETGWRRAAGAAGAALLLADFAAGNRTSFLRLEGEVEIRTPSGYAGVILEEAAAGQWSCAGFDGIRFRARSARVAEYRLLLHTENVRDQDWFGVAFRAGPDWKAYRIPLAELGQVGFGKRVRFDPGRVVALEFRTREGEEGPFRLDLDDIELVR